MCRNYVATAVLFSVLLTQGNVLEVLARRIAMSDTTRIVIDNDKQRKAMSIGNETSMESSMEGLIGTHPISKPGLPAEVWRMKKMLTEKIDLEDDPKCGALITGRKNKLMEALAAMHESHLQSRLNATKPVTAVIVGGGPVGLISAVEAWQGGAVVHVLEQRNGYSRMQNVEIETPKDADMALRNFFEAANALAEVYELFFSDPPKASRDKVWIDPGDVKKIRSRLDKLMSAPISKRMCYYLKSNRHTCVIKTAETLMAASLAILGEMSPGSLNLLYFAQYITTCGVPHKTGVVSEPRAVFRSVATREQRLEPVPAFPCASKELPAIRNIALLADATGGRGTVREQFIGRQYGKTCHTHWQVRVAEQGIVNGVTVPLIEPEVLSMAADHDIDHGEEDAISIVARRFDGLVCPRFSNNALDFIFRLPVFAEEDGSYLGKGDKAAFSEYFWSGLPRFSENSCQYVPILKVPRERNPIAQLIVMKASATGTMKDAIEAHLVEFAQAFLSSMHQHSPTNKLYKAAGGGGGAGIGGGGGNNVYPTYEFGPMSITLFKTSLRVPPFGDSIRGYPSDAKPLIVFAETGDQESPAYYRTGSGISIGADRASRLISVVQKLATSSLGTSDVKEWHVSTLKLSLSKYCLAMHYMLTNTMFPNRFYGMAKAAWHQSTNSTVCSGGLTCSLGVIFEKQCMQTVATPGAIEKLVDPSTFSKSPVHNWFSFEGQGDDCQEAKFTQLFKDIENKGKLDVYSTDLKTHPV